MSVLGADAVVAALAADGWSAPGYRQVAGLPSGYDALFLTRLTHAAGDVLHVCCDGVRLARTAAAVRVFAPEVTVLEFPEWDCAPYDRLSPSADLIARRIDVLTSLGGPRAVGPRLTLTTVSAITQRVPTKETVNGGLFRIVRKKDLNRDALMAYLGCHGYVRSEQVMERGEYAVRGGVIDIFPPGSEQPWRLDFFGDEVESIRSFDVLTQRATGESAEVVLKSMSEVALTAESIARFRTNYLSLFGARSRDDTLYEAVSQNRRTQGLEHWSPLFYTKLDTLLSYLPNAIASHDHLFQETLESRFETIGEYYDARLSITEQGSSPPSRLLEPRALYLAREELERLLAARMRFGLSPYAAADVDDGTLDAGGKPGPDFAAARASFSHSAYVAAQQYIETAAGEGRRVVVAAPCPERLKKALGAHGTPFLTTAAVTWKKAMAAPKGVVPLVELPLDSGFKSPNLAVIAEQDFVGDRLARPTRSHRHSGNIIENALALEPGDLVVHVDHGVGRYEGLETLDLGATPHDCLKVLYARGDRLFVPVENIGCLSRYGSDTSDALLDKLGGVAWQERKAKLKKRLRDMAETLLKIAAARQLRSTEALEVPSGLYDEFCARFSYAETDDQLRAIADTLGDLGKGMPMDRLVCGDVGFGKTEVALRAAFVAAMNGMQVAVITPTTLLARQHYQTFMQRFAGFPLRVGHLSRLVKPGKARQVKDDLAKGRIDIVVGSHAVAAKAVSFANLGLLVVDEEQHFGVAHKERLKQMHSNIHVLTLSATPIPRTLQLALTGVRALSVIATPPVDRLAVRTVVAPFDEVVIRKALLRERQRDGQCFYVCPMISDLDRERDLLKKLVPEFRISVVHGQMAAADMEEAVERFAEGHYDVLLTTNIIESGLDLPNVNTIIIHRADMFGLGQLYQLRGRVGRSGRLAYAYLTLKPGKKLTAAAEKRLRAMHTLDSLGAGFKVAAHDLDIRGAGNLLGDEQSGHIKEVGVELYQRLLAEEIAAAKAGDGSQASAEAWSPQINLAAPVLIPEDYVGDLGLRLNLYRRIGELSKPQDIEEMAAEMADRFGTVPVEARNLLAVMTIRRLCRLCGIEKLDAGPRGMVLVFRDNGFPNPDALVRFIVENSGRIKARADHTIVFVQDWATARELMGGTQRLLEGLARLTDPTATDARRARQDGTMEH